MITNHTQYIAVLDEILSRVWKKLPYRTIPKKGVYNYHPPSYNAAPFREAEEGGEGAHRRLDPLGLAPKVIIEVPVGVKPCLRGIIFRKISEIRSVFGSLRYQIGSRPALRVVPSAAP